MLKKILNWFRKDHAKRSARVLSAFDKIKSDLQRINQSAVKTQSANLVKIAELKEHNDVLISTRDRNTKVIENLARLMGE